MHPKFQSRDQSKMSSKKLSSCFLELNFCIQNFNPEINPKCRQKNKFFFLELNFCIQIFNPEIKSKCPPKKLSSCFLKLNFCIQNLHPEIKPKCSQKKVFFLELNPEINLTRGRKLFSPRNVFPNLNCTI